MSLTRQWSVASKTADDGSKYFELHCKLIGTRGNQLDLSTWVMDEDELAQLRKVVTLAK